MINSTNTNAITGAGTINYSDISFKGTSTTINTTTQTTAGTLQGSKNTAPTAGFIGERIESFIPLASMITLSNNTPANITSISLTPGVWDISSLAFLQFTGSNTGSSTGISTTSATLPGNTLIGQSQWSEAITIVSHNLMQCIPAYRQVISATTIYYFVVNATFSTGSGFANGRISATRVG